MYMELNNNNNMDIKKENADFVEVSCSPTTVIVLFYIPLTVSISDHCGMGRHLFGDTTAMQNFCI